MINKIKYCLIVGISVLLSSCYTVSTIETEVLNPAEKSFPYDVYNVGVLSRMDVTLKSNTGKINKETKFAFERDSMILNNAIIGLLDGLAESPRFEVFAMNPPRVLGGDRSDLNNELSWGLLESLAQKDSLDMIISLTAANFEDTVWRRKDLNNDNFPLIFRGESDLLKEINNSGYNEAYIMFPHLYWRIYDLRNKSIEKFVQVDTLFYTPGPNNGYPSSRAIINYLYENLGDAGYKYSKILAPYWTTEGRAWYPVGDSYFLEAAEMANNGNWTDASKIWRKYAYSKNSKTASKASLNMAVASEMLDKIDIAIEWAKRSKELGLKYYPENYLKTLIKRQKERVLLDSQMN